MISYAMNKEERPFDHSAGLTPGTLAVLGLLNDLSLEWCPEDLAERTIRLLCAAAARSRGGGTHRGHLFLSP